MRSLASGLRLLEPCLTAVLKTKASLIIMAFLLLCLAIFPENTDKNVAEMSIGDFTGYLLGLVIHFIVSFSLLLLIVLMTLILPFLWAKAFLRSLEELHRIHCWQKYLPDAQKERYINLLNEVKSSRLFSASIKDWKSYLNVWMEVDSLYDFYNLVQIDEKLDEIETLVAVRKMSKELISTNRSW